MRACNVLRFPAALLALPLVLASVTPATAVDWDAAFIKDGAQLKRDLQLPPTSAGAPAAGKRVAITTPEYQGTDVHHMLYLPEHWSDSDAGTGKWPVIVEYTGNHFPAAGSTGKVADAGLGYGISGGNFIWITLPFILPDGKANAITWWGDEQATVDYAIKNVPRICDQFGGNPDAVFLCGFSRGAIAVNYIGLYNDEIAKLWRGFITHDHYDGVRQWRPPWGAPLQAYRERAAVRLRRLKGRSSLICQNGSAKQTAAYLETTTGLHGFTFLDVPAQKILGPFPNEVAKHPHNDRWLLKDSPQRRQVWKWVHQVLTTESLEPQELALWEGADRDSKSTITVHLPRAAAKGPVRAAVICPGGGYGGLVMGAEGHGIAKWLNQHGIAGIVLKYELPQGRHDVPLKDAQRALRLVRVNAERWNIDPRQLGIIGFSAGGHLASTAGTHFDLGEPQASNLIDRQSCRPDFMILVYPVITMGELTHGGSKRNLLGADPSKELIRLYSNETQVTKQTPPTFLAHASDDRPVPVENSRMFYQALQTHGVPSQYLELPSGGHGLNGYQGPMWDAWQSGSLRWLKRTAKGANEAK